MPETPNLKNGDYPVGGEVKHEFPLTLYFAFLHSSLDPPKMKIDRNRVKGPLFDSAHNLNLCILKRDSLSQ